MNKADFPQRLNIHFKLSSELLKTVIDVNKKLVKYGSEINFSENHVPHLTIVMGTVKKYSDYLNIADSISKKSDSLSPFKIKVSSPYPKKPSFKYIFVDAFPQEKIKSEKNKIYKNIKDWIDLDHHGGPNNHVHITIGYINNSKNIKNLIEDLEWDIKESIIKSIGISTTSSRGTCLNELNSFELNSFSK